MGRFDDRATRPARGPADIFRWYVLDTLRGKRVRDPGGYVTPVRPNDGSRLATPEASLTWIGHASFVLRLGGQLIATDPVFSERISGVIRRRAPPGVALESLPPLGRRHRETTGIHYDHLDLLPTLRRFGRPKPVYADAPGATAPSCDAPGLDEDRRARLVASRIAWSALRGSTAVPARHWSMRMPWNRNDMLWGGFVFRGPEGVAYHSGDTALFDGFAEIGRRVGPIDWAMLPIGAYEPRWFMEPQHMNPEDAVAAFEQLGARRLVAMHWGTLRSSPTSPSASRPSACAPGAPSAGWTRGACGSSTSASETRALGETATAGCWK